MTAPALTAASGVVPAAALTPHAGKVGGNAAAAQKTQVSSLSTTAADGSVTTIVTYSDGSQTTTVTPGDSISISPAAAKQAASSSK